MYAQPLYLMGINFGSDPELLVKQGASAETTRESYLRFDIPAVSVTSAMLRLYGHLSATDDAAVVTSAFGVADTGWQTSTLTWNNRPTGGTALGTITVAGTTPAWVQIDVTGYVNAEISAGHRAITIALRNPTHTTTRAGFNSGDAAANNPELIIR